MSSRQRTFVIVVFTLLLIATLFIVWTSSYVREPVYQGKRLAGWVEQWKTNRWSVPKTATNHAAEKEAAAAISAIGTNGIPFLLDLMQARESNWRGHAKKIIPRSWHARLHLNDLAGWRKEIGANGLAALGEQAAPAVPALIGMVRSSDYDASYLSVWTLGNLRAGATSAIPVLIECVSNRDESIRIDALHGLGWIPDSSNTIVPALLSHVPFAKSRNGNGELCAIVGALGNHHTNATAAVPLLLELLHYPDVTVRSYATSSLARIDKAAAGNHGVHWP